MIGPRRVTFDYIGTVHFNCLKKTYAYSYSNREGIALEEEKVQEGAEKMGYKSPLDLMADIRNFREIASRIAQQKDCEARAERKKEKMKKAKEKFGDFYGLSGTDLDGEYSLEQKQRNRIESEEEQ